MRNLLKIKVQYDSETCEKVYSQNQTTHFSNMYNTNIMRMNANDPKSRKTIVYDLKLLR